VLWVSFCQLFEHVLSRNPFSAEHSFFLYSGLYGSHNQLMVCNNTDKDVVELFFETQRRHLFSTINYHALLIPILEWTNVTMTFCWNSIDIFIIVVSIGLAYRYEQLNERIKSARYKVCLYF
jgi:gustatory receptor